MSTQPQNAQTTLLRPGQRGEYLGFAHLEEGGKDGRAKAKVESIMLEVKKFRDDQALAAQLGDDQGAVEVGLISGPR